MTATHSGKQWTTQKYRYATSGKPSNQSDARTKNHLSDRTAAASAKHVRTKSMASLYEIEKQLESLMELKTVIESVQSQVKAMGIILGIDMDNPDQTE
jgi:hypothetical protein